MNSLFLLAPTLSLSAFAFALFGVDTIDDRLSRKSARSVGFWVTLAGIVTVVV